MKERKEVIKVKLIERKYLDSLRKRQEFCSYVVKVLSKQWLVTNKEFKNFTKKLYPELSKGKWFYTTNGEFKKIL